MGFLRSLKGARRRGLLSMALVAVAAIGAGAASQASAGNAGQTGIWGIQGPAAGHLQTPNLFAAEENGSVFVGDRPEGPGSLRLQKFSATGTLEGSAKILTPAGEVFTAMAVDSTAHRIYLLRTRPESDPETERAMAEVVKVYSTIPNGSQELEELAVGGTITLPTDEEHAIDNPAEMVLDPVSGELEILGEIRERKFVLQRIGTATGTVGPRYVETSGTFGLQGAKGAKGALAIGPDGKSYVVWTVGLENHAASLPEDLSTPTVLSGFGSTLEQIRIERPSEGAQDGTGHQIAISQDGSTLYFKTALSRDQVNGGNVLAFAYSLEDGNAFAVYGGKNEEGHCTIQGTQAALAPVGDTLFVLDQGNEAVPSPWGVKVMRFGPGGSECPAPSAGFALKVGANPVTEVHAGTIVTLDGSASDPGGFNEAIESLTWKVKGPTPASTFEETVPTTDAASLTLQHAFTEEGSYTVRLTMHLKNQTTKLLPFDARSQPLTVTAPAAGQPPTVTEVSPNHGVAAGGNTVTIKGTEFTGATAVKFGASTATNLNVIGATELTVKAPAGTAGSAVDVTVTTPEGTSTTGAADKYTYDSVLQTLSVTKAGTGSGTVTSSPAGISCGTTCSASFTQGQSVSLTATPAAGSTFGGWTGACTGTGSCVVTMSAAKSVVATFTAATTEPPKTTPPGTTPPGTTPPPPPPPAEKTKAQKLAEQRKAALKKCQKLKGKAKALCIKKANQIGKPKPKKHKK